MGVDFGEEATQFAMKNGGNKLQNRLEKRLERSMEQFRSRSWNDWRKVLFQQMVILDKTKKEHYINFGLERHRRRQHLSSGGCGTEFKI